MAFVLLLLLSITTLVQVETRSASIASAQMEAEQSALLGLNLALGELQKTAGPDQRVTAVANINPANTAQPHLLGVWKSFTQSNDGTGEIKYDDQKRDDFKQWLSSTATIADKTNQTYPTAAPTNPVTLVGSGTLPTPVAGDPTTQYVQVSTVNVLGASGNRSGGYAWQVFDESQKANLTLRNPVTTANATPPTDAERVSALGTAGAPNFTALAQGSNGNALYAPLENLTAGEQEKTVSLSGSALLGGATFDPQAANAFHALTTDSKSLLVDVANGGFQKDLSLLFEAATLPPEYKDRHIYSELDTPVAPEPTRFVGAEPMPSPDPKWSLLRSHYGLYKDKYEVEDGDGEVILKDKLTVTGGNYSIAASKVERDAATGFFDAQQLLPVVSNAQFIFSLTTEKHRTKNINFLTLLIDPVITLWNPYNVELRFPKMEMEFYRFPLDIKFMVGNGVNGVNASVGNEGYVNIANMFNLGGSFGSQDDKPYRARIHPLVGGDDIVMKPGEYKIFSPTEHVRSSKNGQYIDGAILKEGWVPNGKAGGFSSRNLLLNDSGSSVAAGRGNWVKLQIGNVVTLAVRARKVVRQGTGFAETNNEEIAAYLKVFQGDGGTGATSVILDRKRIQVGAIELDLADLSTNLPDIEPLDLLMYTLTKEMIQSWGNASLGKVPFLNASLRLKTENDSDTINSQPNASLWLHNGVTNPYFTTGIPDLDGNLVDQNEDPKSHQYELTWTGMTSWDDIPAVEYNPTNNRGYGGTGVESGSGVEFAPFLQVPLAPATSIAQFSHAPLNTGGQAPLTAQIVGNSFNSPLLPLGEKSNLGSIGTHLDHSYMANTTLFDGYFLSTATEETGALYGTSGRSLSVVLSQFFDGSQQLPNSNFEPATSITPTVTAADYDTFAQHLYNKGAFNVNSTSEEAWALFLASGTNEALPILDMLTASTTLADAATSSDFAVSRFAPMIGDEDVSTSVYGQDRWLEHRRLTPDQIVTLAEKVVDEVKARGPFQSVAEFVNRQLVNTAATGNSGALQTAIENSDLNAGFGLDTPIYAPKNNDELSGSGTGTTSDGAATQITQADLLNRLAPSLTVRGDTFRIRAYGETESIGGHTSKAWCEAVVQRQHDFVDDTLAPTGVPAAGSANETFGRRFKIVSFRWLSADEV
jgi:hypothetical protein